MTNLFGPDAPRVLNLPAGSPFLIRVARGLIDSLQANQHPGVLADAIIYVPNRRSARALAYALFQANGGKALMLPDIRALGDLESTEPPPSAENRLADLPPIYPPGKRLGELSRLIMAYFNEKKAAIPASTALSSAREMASLLDQAALSGDVDWNGLDELVQDQALARHWEESVEFLHIITRLWPDQLKSARAMDPFARRLAAAEAMAEFWRQSPPTSPVIIAGSTGATPASQVLMRAVLEVPHGLIILPGLDPDISPASATEVRQTPSHPQFTLLRALDRLGISTRNVVQWPGQDPEPAHTARGRLIQEALAPAKETAAWTRRLKTAAGPEPIETFVKRAVEGLDLIAAKDETDEAHLAALLVRQTFETPHQTAALVTPDIGLTRRVSAILKSYGIDCQPSAGRPLSQTDAGSFAILIGAWICDPTHPVRLLAVLRHKLSRFDPDAVNLLDRYILRGPRLWQSPDAFLAHADNILNDPSHSRPGEGVRSQLHRLLEDLSQVLFSVAEMIPASSSQTTEHVLSMIAQASTLIGSGPTPWTGEDGAALSKLFSNMLDMSAPLGLIPTRSIIDLLTQELTRETIRDKDGEGRVAIWSPLEARLQSADHIILAGLNEGVWPSQPPADAFLPRRFRTLVGLSDPDERVGLSAHDFAQLACAPRVTLLYAKRRDDKPAVASRWIWRLRMLVRSALEQTESDRLLAPGCREDPRIWLQALEQTPPPDPDLKIRPEPRPPVHARPKRLSVTRIEALIRDPYAIYCEAVLKLRKLDEPCRMPDARHKGTAIHAALEAFEKDGAHWSADALVNRLEKELADQGISLAELIALRTARERVVRQFLSWHAARAPALSKHSLIESKGSLDISLGAGTFKLTGTADRIDVCADQTLVIYDFKSGIPPSKKQVDSGLAPQMPLLGLIAKDGHFTGLDAPRAISDLAYIRFGTAFEVTPASQSNSAEDLIAQTRTGLHTLLRAFDDPLQPYLSVPRPARIKHASDYDRLSRRDEWQGLETYD